jgi:hypothetical protein
MISASKPRATTTKPKAMTRVGLCLPLLTVLAAGGCGRAGAGSESKAAPVIHASAAAPVVVEEFQSQGCSSCPPANANVNALSGRPEVLALSYAVTYWDGLGWKDTFASPAFTQRQWDYAHFAGRANVATPQVIVNGGPKINGGDAQQLEQVMAQEGSPAGGPAIAARNGAVALAGGKPPQPATVWLVRYDPNVRWVAIRAGENEGRKLPHRNVVRELVALGEWKGPAASFKLPTAKEAGLSSAVLVQAGKGGPILAARKI